MDSRGSLFAKGNAFFGLTAPSEVEGCYALSEVEGCYALSEVEGCYCEVSSVVEKRAK